MLQSFTEKWADVLTENVLLKWAVLVLLVSVVVLSVSIVQVSINPPFVIDRGKKLEKAGLEKYQYSNRDITTFLKTALSQRFDELEVVNENFFSPEEVIRAKNELSEMKTRGISQRALVSEVEKTQSSNWKATVDRVVGYKEVKTLLPISVEVVLKRVSFNEVNPYGLKIEKIVVVTKDSNKKKNEGGRGENHE